MRRALYFRDLLRDFIAPLKQRAELATGRPFEQAVFGRPVFFVDDDAGAGQLAEDTLATIAREVGFKDIAFQYEPIAAAFDYETRIAGEERVLVADIGGGTSDFSLVRLPPGRALAGERRDDGLAAIAGGPQLGRLRRVVDGVELSAYDWLGAGIALFGMGIIVAGWQTA